MARSEDLDPQKQSTERGHFSHRKYEIVTMIPYKKYLILPLRLFFFMSKIDRQHGLYFFSIKKSCITGKIDSYYVSYLIDNFVITF